MTFIYPIGIRGGGRPLNSLLRRQGPARLKTEYKVEWNGTGASRAILQANALTVMQEISSTR